MMTFERFVNEIERGVAAVLGSDYHVEAKKVTKNNGVALTGLMIGKAEGRVALAIYLNPLYESYSAGNGHNNLEEMAELIVAEYKEQQGEAEQMRNELGEFLDYEKNKDKIVFKLINTEENREILKRIPSQSFHDLSIVFMLYLGERERGISTALISNEHMALWNVTESELYEEAKKNTPRLLPETFVGISEMIQDSLRYEGDGDMNAEQMDGCPSPFYILTNRLGIEGAACMIYPGVVRRCADKLNCDLLILPSSIHETLLLPYDCMVNVEEMREMVQSVNRSVVSVEDRLSGQVYMYKRSEDRIAVAV